MRLPDTTSIAERHLRLIAYFAIRNWRRLPACVKSYYDADDMIADVVLHVVRVSSRYDPSVARETTWVGNVAQNRSRYLVDRYSAKMRVADVVALDFINDLEEPFARRHLQDSRDAVERVIQYGSDGVRSLLAALLAGDVETAKRLKTDVTVRDLRRVAASCSASFADFAMVCRYAS